MTNSGLVPRRPDYQYPDGYRTTGDQKKTLQQWRFTLVTRLFDDIERATHTDRKSIMKHLVSHAQDGTINLAVVDDNTGELDQIGTFIWPNGYGLTEAAVLGTNLTQFLQLNGTGATTPVQATVVHQHDGPDDMRTATERDRKRRSSRESYYRKKGYSKAEAVALSTNGPQPGKAAPPPGHVLEAAPDVDAPLASRQGPKPKAPNHRYISWEEVAAVIDAHPEGISCSDIAKDILGYPEQWATKAVLQPARQRSQARRLPLSGDNHVTDGGLKKKRYHGPERYDASAKA